MVYVFLARGFEEIEALTPVDLLRRAGVEVTTVGVGGKLVTGAHGISVQADITEQEAMERLLCCDMELLVLPGGMPGTANLDENPTVDVFISEAQKKNIPVAAICAAPMILGKRGILQGKKAVCYPGYEKYLQGAQFENEPVVRDGNIICARAMGSAAEFALALVSLLKGEGEAQRIRSSVLL